MFNNSYIYLIIYETVTDVQELMQNIIDGNRLLYIILSMVLRASLACLKKMIIGLKEEIKEKIFGQIDFCFPNTLQ